MKPFFYGICISVSSVFVYAYVALIFSNTRRWMTHDFLCTNWIKRRRRWWRRSQLSGSLLTVAKKRSCGVRQRQLTAEHASYASHNSDLRALLSDFVQHLLIDKPSDVLDFCTQYFDAFSAAYSEVEITSGSGAGRAYWQRGSRRTTWCWVVGLQMLSGDFVSFYIVIYTDVTAIRLQCLRVWTKWHHHKRWQCCVLWHVPSFVCLPSVTDWLTDWQSE